MAELKHGVFEIELVSSLVKSYGYTSRDCTRISGEVKAELSLDEPSISCPAPSLSDQADSTETALCIAQINVYAR
jgi:hypothetical protein